MAPLDPTNHQRTPGGPGLDADSPAIVVRRATPADRSALVLLAQLDGAEPLRGEVLVAEVEGRLCAARSVSGRRAISDPFLPTAALLELLDLRARHLVEGVTPPARSFRALVRPRLRRAGGLP